MSTQRMSFHIGIVAIAAFVAFAGCVAPQAPRASTDGAFEGTISRVWEDGLSLDVDGGGTILIDTWSVCGDGTARNLSPGDSVRVYATRDLVSYDAWRILNVEGQPACGTGVAAVAQESGDDEGDTRARRSADEGAFEGTVSRVWEDGLTLDVNDGGTITVDTWSVCGDNTARDINRGDALRVYAYRQLVGYDAWRILNAEGQPACGTGVAAVAQESGDDKGDTRARRSADEGAFEGTVSRVWEDGLTLDVNGGGTITVDTWSVCGDNTARDINRGDALRVYASRDFGGYDAWQIVNEASEPACSRR